MFRRSRFLKTESKPIFGFPHTRNIWGPMPQPLSHNSELPMYIPGMRAVSIHCPWWQYHSTGMFVGREPAWMPVKSWRHRRPRWRCRQADRVSLKHPEARWRPAAAVLASVRGSAAPSSEDSQPYTQQRNIISPTSIKITIIFSV